MLAAARPPRRARAGGVTPIANARGFTLIELLVVVVIIGVLALALTLSIRGNTERQLTREAERFQALVDEACNQAELTGREIGVVVGADAFSFRVLAGARWQSLDDGELRPRRWIDALGVDLAREGRRVELSSAPQTPPQLVCYSSGELTPFVLTLTLGDAPRYRVTGADDATLKVARVERSP